MKYLDLLGCTVTDKVTGVKGIAESISYDLYGCIHIAIRQPMNEKGEMPDSRWFDAKRLTVSLVERVMPLPAFDDRVQEPGPADRPAPVA